MFLFFLFLIRECFGRLKSTLRFAILLRCFRHTEALAEVSISAGLSKILRFLIKPQNDGVFFVIE